MKRGVRSSHHTQFASESPIRTMLAVQVPVAGLPGPNYAIFQQIDTDGTGSITAEEMKQALTLTHKDDFDLKTVKLLIRIVDKDGGGTIDPQEFESLLAYVNSWKQSFDSFDTDKGGTLDRDEIYRALKAVRHDMFIESVSRYNIDHKADPRPTPLLTPCSHALSFVVVFTPAQQNGYNLSPENFENVRKAFDTDGGASIGFDEYIQMCISMQTITSEFQRMDMAGGGGADGRVEFASPDHLLQSIIYTGLLQE